MSSSKQTQISKITAIIPPFVRGISLRLDLAAQGLLMLLCMGMAVDIMLQVFCRYVLNYSLFWSEELGRLLLVWLTFIGASVAYKRGVHVGVGFVTKRLPRKLGYLCLLVAHLASMVLFAVMLVHGWKFMLMLASQMTVSLGVSKQVPFMVIPMAGGVMLVHGACFFMDTLAEWRK